MADDKIGFVHLRTPVITSEQIFTDGNNLPHNFELSANSLIIYHTTWHSDELQPGNYLFRTAHAQMDCACTQKSYHWFDNTCKVTQRL